MDVCRLCMSNKELIWVFDQQLNSAENDMKTVILVTTGVEILQNEVISQKICKSCKNLTAKMFEFRKRAVRTDIFIKNQYKELLKNSEMTLEMPNSTVSITKRDVTKIETPAKIGNKISIKHVPSDKTPNKITITPVPLKSLSKEDKPEEPNAVEIEQSFLTEKTNEMLKSTKSKIHSSIGKIFSKYADIQIPSACLKLDFNPCVSMEMDTVEEYFRHKNIDMKKYVQNVLRYNRASKKIPSTNVGKSSRNSKKDKEESRLTVEENKPNTSKIKENIIVSSLSIKLSDVKSQLPVITKEKRKLNGDDNDDIINKTPRMKRRRLSSNDLTSEGDINQPTLMETLQLKPIEHKRSTSNSSKFNTKLQFTERCSYCKTKFKCIARKEEHDKKCVAKLALSRAYVALEKIDITKYQAKDFYPKTDAIYIEEHIKKNDEIIELSDDEDDIASKVIASTSSTSSTTPTATITPQLIGVQPFLVPLTQTYVPSPETAMYSTAIVRPLIEVKDNDLLNTIDTTVPDYKLLKELLTKTGLFLSVEGESQTKSPSNDEIIKMPTLKTAELKNLLSQLSVYKIPVCMKKGDFNVSYAKNECKKKKKFVGHWNHLKPKDIKTNDPFFNPENLNRHISQGIPLFPKTVQTAPTILNHTLMNNLPEEVQHSNAPSNNLHMFAIPNAHLKNLTQQVQTSTVPSISLTQQIKSNIQALNVQLGQTSTNLPHQIQTVKLARQIQTSTVPTISLPHKIQTSNIQTVKLPQHVQSSTVPTIVLPRKIQTANVQTCNLPPRVQTSTVPTISLPQQIQTSNIQTNMLPHQFQFGNVQNPLFSTDTLVNLNQNLQNIPPTPVLTTSIQNLANNYFVQPSATIVNADSPQIIASDTGNVDKLGTFLHKCSTSSNTKGFTNNQVNNNNSLSTSFNNLHANNKEITGSNSVICYSLPRSNSKTPPPNVNLFLSTIASSSSSFNTIVSNNNMDLQDKSIKPNDSETSNVAQRPIIRVRNLCDLK